MGRSDCCYEIEISMEEGRVEIKCVTFGFDETRGELSVREMTCVFILDSVFASATATTKVENYIRDDEIALQTFAVYRVCTR